MFKTIMKGVSTLGTSAIGYSYMISKYPHNLSLVAVGALVGATVGASVAFWGIPKLLERKLRGLAFGLGLAMASSWLLNSSYLIEEAKKEECSKIDSKYSYYKNKYDAIKPPNIYESKTKLDLISKINDLKAKIEIASANSSKSNSKYKRLEREVTDFLAEEKKKNAKYYIGVASDYRCKTSPSGGISYKKLYSCVIGKKWANLSGGALEGIEGLQETLVKAQSDLKSEILRENSTKESRATKLKEQNEYKASYLAIEKKASKNLEATEFGIYVFMLIIGLLVEVVYVMFGDVLDLLDERKRAKDEAKARAKKAKEDKLKVEKEVEEKKALLEQVVEKVEVLQEELQEANEEARKIIHNHELMNFMIAIANDTDYKGSMDFKYALRTRYKNGSRGQVLALANSILGAFLYASTIKNENGESVSTWKELNQIEIIYTNGGDGKENVNKKTVRKTLGSFISNINNATIKTLGSTANKLNNKNIREYFIEQGMKPKAICPQQEALDYLVKKEEECLKIRKDGEKIYTLSPLNISIADAKGLIASFVKIYYPAQFVK